jgi:hypothetical protein
LRRSRCGVDDAWQRRGIGGLLLREILSLLRDQGYEAAVGFVEPSNLAARHLMQRVWPGATSKAVDNIIQVRLPLASVLKADQQAMPNAGAPPRADGDDESRD